MHRDDPPPAAWGDTIVIDIAPYEPTDEWRESLPGWSDCVRRNPESPQMHHGSRGALHVDTIAIAVDGVIAALCDSRHITMENQYAYDQEYFQYLRLRDVVDAAAWAKLPWTALSRGHVFLAWDKFHWNEYVRRPGDPEDDEMTMSFGGGWSLLEGEINERHFPDQEPPRPIGAPTDADLLAAVRGNRLERVREYLALGANANAVPIVPPSSGLAFGVSHARDANLLWESVHNASPAVTEALLEAGAAVDARPPGGLTALIGAIINNHTDHVPSLLAHGADPSITHNGKSALELAEAHDPELARLMRALSSP